MLQSTQKTGALPTGVLCGTRSNSCTILMSNSSKDSKSYRKKITHNFHEQTLQMNQICTWQHRSHWCTNNTLFLNTTSGGNISYITEYGAQIRAARDKAKNSLVKDREKLNADFFLWILICPTHTFHKMTVPNTSLRKQLCYIKCNVLFLKIEWPVLELRSFILTDVCLPRYQT